MRLQVTIAIDVKDKREAMELFSYLEPHGPNGELWEIVGQSLDDEWVDDEMDGWHA